MRARLAGEWAVFLLAVQFLTRLPLPRDIGYTPARLAAAVRWHPAVGALVGGFAAGVYWLAAQIWDPLLAALVSTAAGLLATGCFHEDGFADACDGLGGGPTRERALEIMRDSRLGAYGAAGLGLMLAGKVLALGGMPGAVAPLVLIAGHAASRASSVVVIASSSYLRDHGAGKPVSAGIGPRGLALALATGAAALAGTAAVLPPSAVAAGVAGLIAGHVAMRRSFERRLGGYTGDCLGAVQQTSEVGFYLGVLACL